MEIRSTRGNAILFWKVADGDTVEAGQVVASLEQGMVSEGQLLATVG